MIKKLSAIIAFGAILMLVQASKASASDVVLLQCDGSLKVHAVQYHSVDPGIVEGDECAFATSTLLGLGYELKSTTELGIKEEQNTGNSGQKKVKNPNHPSLPAVLMIFVGQPVA
ncbi:MAG: hypothetical protein ACREQ7_19185 [Candidatus Binatia bacterium]